MIDAETIRTRHRGKADFFSWQLYIWVRADPLFCQIWRGTWNSATGVDPTQPVLYIGWMDEDDQKQRWLHGRMLRNLCCCGQSLERYAYGPAHDTAHWEEITEQWWAEYMRIGVCAIHGDLAHDWDERGDVRTCRHCRKVEVRSIELVQKPVWTGLSPLPSSFLPLQAPGGRGL